MVIVLLIITVCAVGFSAYTLAILKTLRKEIKMKNKQIQYFKTQVRLP